MKKLKAKKSLLSAALKDLNSELRILKRERQDLSFSIKNTDDTLNMTRAKETALRNKLSRMISKENTLSNKKEKLQKDIVKLKQKIDKVSKVSRDLGDI